MTSVFSQSTCVVDVRVVPGLCSVEPGLCSVIRHIRGRVRNATETRVVDSRWLLFAPVFIVLVFKQTIRELHLTYIDVSVDGFNVLTT